MVSPILIEDEAELKRVCRTLKKECELGVDTESDGFYAYRDKICLVQISTRDQDYIIDAVKLTSLGCLEGVFHDRKILKVFHAAANDIPHLKRDFCFETRGVFDTAQALRLLGEKSVGLASVLKDRFGVRLNKKFQRYNWGKRPIKKEALKYAAADSHYLIPLKDQLLDQLKARGLQDEALEHFRELEKTQPVELGFDPDGFWKIKGHTTLEPEGLSVLRALYLFREEVARKKDLPPFRVIPNQALINIAREKPRSLKALSGISHVPKTFKGERGKRLLAIVRDALKTDPPERRKAAPKRSRTCSTVFSALKTWRKEEAARRGVDSDLIVATATLDEIARACPEDLESLAQVPGMGPCRMDLYGKAILKVVEKALGTVSRRRPKRAPKRPAGSRTGGRKSAKGRR